MRHTLKETLIHFVRRNRKKYNEEEPELRVDEEERKKLREKERKIKGRSSSEGMLDPLCN